MPTVQATAVCKDNKSIIIMGPSGSGKSLLALSLIDQGWTLIGDDLLETQIIRNRFVVSPMAKMRGCIEARTLGIISGLPYKEKVPVIAFIMLEKEPPERLPDQKLMDVSLEKNIPVFRFWQEEKYLPTLVSNAVKIASGQLNLLQNEMKNA